MRTQGRSEDLELLISQEKSGWFLEGNIEEELKKEEYNQKKQKLTDNQIEVLEVIELANGLEITAKDIEERLDIKQASGIRILKALAKKGFLIQNKKNKLESRGAVLTFKIKSF